MFKLVLMCALSFLCLSSSTFAATCTDLSGKVVAKTNLDQSFNLYVKVDRVPPGRYSPNPYMAPYSGEVSRFYAGMFGQLERAWITLNVGKPGSLIVEIREDSSPEFTYASLPVFCN
jgi:hypothetical protein